MSGELPEGAAFVARVDAVLDGVPRRVRAIAEPGRTGARRVIDAARGIVFDGGKRLRPLFACGVGAPCATTHPTRWSPRPPVWSCCTAARSSTTT